MSLQIMCLAASNLFYGASIGNSAQSHNWYQADFLRVLRGPHLMPRIIGNASGTDKRSVEMLQPHGGDYFFGGLIMMWAPAVPGDISQGALSLGLVERPVDCGVAKGT